MSLLGVSKTVQRVSLASLILLIGAIGSCYVGKWNWEIAKREKEREEAASEFSMSGGYIEENMWQIGGTLVFFAGLAVAIAAFMLWRQDRQD